MASIKLDGNTLTSTELSLVAMGEKVEVASDAWIRVDALEMSLIIFLKAEKLFMVSIQVLVHWLVHLFLQRI